VRVRGGSGLTIHGAALIDERSRTFHSFVLAKDGRFRLAHSGDVKVYENVEALPRAFVAPQAQIASNDDEAIAMMQSRDFDPATTVVLQGATIEPDHSSRAPRHSLKFTRYDPEFISIEVDTDSEGYLVLTDAWYPGWVATVDGEPVEVLRADVLFRAAPIQAGAHTVEFRYEPMSFKIGLVISVTTIFALIVTTVIGVLRKRREKAPIPVS